MREVEFNSTFIACNAHFERHISCLCITRSLCKVNFTLVICGYATRDIDLLVTSMKSNLSNSTFLHHHAFFCGAKTLAYLHVDINGFFKSFFSLVDSFRPADTILFSLRLIANRTVPACIA